MTSVPVMCVGVVGLEREIGALRLCYGVEGQARRLEGRSLGLVFHPFYNSFLRQ